MAAPPMKSPLHDFPLTFLKWNTKKDRRSCPPPSPQPQPKQPSSSPPSSPPPFPVGSRSSRTRRPATPLLPEPEPEPEPEQASEEVEKQWNLRPRRRAGAAGGEGCGATAAAVDAVDKSVGSGNGDREKKRFWIALSKDEIEQDIYSMTGSKPSRRPRKHPKTVQKCLDNAFPGLWLVGFTPDTYRNFEPPPHPKR